MTVPTPATDVFGTITFPSTATTSTVPDAAPSTTIAPPSRAASEDYCVLAHRATIGGVKLTAMQTGASAETIRVQVLKLYDLFRQLAALGEDPPIMDAVREMDPLIDEIRTFEGSSEAMVDLIRGFADEFGPALSESLRTSGCPL